MLLHDGERMSPTMVVDHHTHLVEDHVLAPAPFTPEQVRRYRAAARDRGLAAVGISDHGHRFKAYRPIMAAMFEPEPAVGAAWMARRFQHELGPYVEAILQVKEDGEPVLLGIEADFVTGYEEAIAGVLEGHPWDFVIGSVHFYEDWAWAATREGWDDVDAAYHRYFETLGQAARSGLFDIMSHPDLVKKFGHRPSFDLEPLYRETARIFADAGVCAEINTAGWHHDAAEVYPHPDFLAVLVEQGVPITLGSDAHVPELVARDFDRARELLARCGGTQVASVVKGQVRFEPL